MKRYLPLMTVILILALTALPAMCQEVKVKNKYISDDQNKLPDPTPPMSPVPPEKLLSPEKGLGSVQWGDSIEKVEKIFGRGVLIPGKPDFEGDNFITLKYVKKGLVFKFFNGKMAMIIVDKPGYATKTGVQVGGDIGDLIREFGSKYNMNKSLMAGENTKEPDYEIMYKAIAASVKGNLILKLRLMSPKKFK